MSYTYLLLIVGGVSPIMSFHMRLYLVMDGVNSLMGSHMCCLLLCHEQSCHEYVLDMVVVPHHVPPTIVVGHR